MNLTIDIDAKELQRAFDRAPRLTVTKLQKWVDTTAARSERTAKREVPVDKGPLQSSIRMKIGALNALVKPNIEYAPYVHDGTGIYGPKRRAITPKKGKYLVFTIDGREVFARSVRGQKANPFMDRTYKSVKPIAHRDGQTMLNDLVRSI